MFHITGIAYVFGLILVPLVEHFDRYVGPIVQIINLLLLLLLLLLIFITY